MTRLERKCVGKAAKYGGRFELHHLPDGAWLARIVLDGAQGVVTRFASKSDERRFALERLVELA